MKLPIRVPSCKSELLRSHVWLGDGPLGAHAVNLVAMKAFGLAAATSSLLVVLLKLFPRTVHGFLVQSIACGMSGVNGVRAPRNAVRKVASKFVSAPMNKCKLMVVERAVGKTKRKGYVARSPLIALCHHGPNGASAASLATLASRSGRVPFSRTRNVEGTNVSAFWTKSRTASMRNARSTAQSVTGLHGANVLPRVAVVCKDVRAKYFTLLLLVEQLARRQKMQGTVP